MLQKQVFQKQVMCKMTMIDPLFHMQNPTFKQVLVFHVTSISSRVLQQYEEVFPF